MTLEDPDNPLRPAAGSEELTDARFDPYRTPRTDRLLLLVRQITGMIQVYEDYFRLRKRRRRPTDQDRFEATVGAIISNAIRRELLFPGEWVAVPLGKSVLGRRATRYSAALPKTLPELLNVLSSPELDFIEVRRGYRGAGRLGRGRLTTFRVARSLRSRIEEQRIALTDVGQSTDQETIILKGEKVRGTGAFLDYADDERTRRDRAAMRRINEHLALADIALEPDEVSNPVDPTDRLLRRYFNNGSFEQGGRLFGGFWQEIPKEERHAALRIDDESIAVLDYAQMGIRLLYALDRLAPPVGDAYLPPPPWPEWPQKVPYWPREGMKKVLNAMLCRVGPVVRMPRDTRPLFNAVRRNVKAQEVVDALATYHQAVRHRFLVGYGIHLMRAESDILVAVLLRLIDEGITSLPIHDAVIVARHHATRTAQVMRDVFREETGGEIEVNEQRPSRSPLELIK